MSLSGRQRKKIQEALINAFPNMASLEQMLSFELNKNLRAIAPEGSLEQIVFVLIQAAESQGWIENLIHAAYKTNPGNPKLQAIAQTFKIAPQSVSNILYPRNPFFTGREIHNGIEPRCDNDDGQLFGTPTPVIPFRIQFKPSVFIPFASLVITGLVTVTRFSGILQGFELRAFDQMMRLRPDLGIDPRLLVVTIDETDRKYQDENGMKRHDSSLSDTALAQLLEKLEPLQPRVIGLDIIRDFPVSSDQPKLAKNLQNTDNFIGICIGNDPTNKDTDPTIREKGIKPPPEIPADRIGFADVQKDSDGILRRYLWSATFNSNTDCNTDFSLSLKLALYYLAKKDIKRENTSSGDLVLGKARLQRFLPRSGGYQSLQNDGYQMLLNYRSRNIARQCSLTDILQKNTCNPSWVKDKIILIGVTASSVKDDFYTPYSINEQPDQTMRGVFVQAQMVSQIISAALDGHPPLLKVLPWWGDIFYTWIWSLVGGVFILPVLQKITRRDHKIIFVLASTGFILIVSYGTCLFILIKGYWLPFIPSTIAALSTGIIMFKYNHKFTDNR
ncbi:MAG: CHASE2 domain-containing protein [Rhizonema sp. PD38]|nr:CHASE2 domain-containing protein [Rhizonema sp. PD38]